MTDAQTKTSIENAVPCKQSGNSGAVGLSRESAAGVLARADLSRLEQAFADLPSLPHWIFVRGPEAGLIMIRGRIGGGGQAFNLGEASVSRASVRLEDGRTGHSYVLGRSLRHAEIMAVIDALLAEEGDAQLVQAQVLQPLIEDEAERRRAREDANAATKVDFFTMTRGETPE